ncbi:hypothetical protein BDV24DRAFT_129238 [Aspergillus arachidicola]|uniref:Uncharacterized protein n=1 Tax=Aspergillus arachidicola TaxID=656916 RepID=A0A5N6YD84_9EURO|nr:hypothetical protein BDV24DRAFT_129238 [Aspergillus arachidicola]
MKKHCGNPKLDESILKSAYLWEIYKSPESYQEMWEILDLHLIFRSTEQRNWEETNRKVSDLKRQCKRSRVWKWIFITAEIGAQLCIAAGALTATALTAGLASPTLIGAAFVGAFLEHVCAKERERHAKKKNQLREAEVLRRDVERRLPAAPIIKVGHPIGISVTGSSRPYILSLDKLGELGLGMPAAGVQPRAHCHPTQLQRQPPAQYHRESASAPLAPPPPSPAPPPPPPPAPPYRGPLQKKPPAQYHRESASASLAPPPPPPAPPYRGPLQRQPPFPLASTVVDIKKATMVQLDTI